LGILHVPRVAKLLRRYTLGTVVARASNVGGEVSGTGLLDFLSELGGNLSYGGHSRPEPYRQRHRQHHQLLQLLLPPFFKAAPALHLLYFIVNYYKESFRFSQIL
jgi:hypothetical protein